MNSKTRQVLALLADDLTDHILERCAQQPRSEAELVKSSSSGRRTVSDRALLLEAHGLLVRELRRDGAVGRPGKRWEPGAQREVAALERTADAFVLALRQAQVDDQQAAIDARRAEDVQLSEPESPAAADASDGQALR